MRSTTWIGQAATASRAATSVRTSSSASGSSGSRRPRPQGDPRMPRNPAGGQQHEDRGVGDLLEQPVEGVEGGRVAPVEVLDQAG